ncbi:hypothetical protein P7C70_g1483, partial [Phenoliferia sp. Uapishka_3]
MCSTFPFQELSLHRFYALAAASAELHERMRDDTDGDVENAHKLITKCCNRVGAEVEFSAPAVALSLLFNKDHYSSETFVGLDLALFASRVAALVALTEQEGPVEAAAIAGAAVAAGPSDTVAREPAVLEPSSEDVEMGGITDSAEEQGFEFVQMEIDENTNTVVEHNQADDYLFRNEQLETECLYLFVARYEVITKAGDRLNSRGARTGYSANRRYDFTKSHPRFKSHRQRERTQPIIPRIEGRSVPRRDHPDPKVREWYAKSILILFKPWRTLDDLKEGSESWENALARFDAPPEVQCFIENLQFLHRMKEDAENELQQRQYPPQAMSGGLDHDEDENVGKRSFDLLTPEEHAKALEAQLESNLEDSWSRTALSILSSKGYFSLNKVSETARRASNVVSDPLRTLTREDMQQKTVWELELKDQDAKNDARRKYGRTEEERRLDLDQVETSSSMRGFGRGGREAPGIGIKEQDVNQMLPVAFARRYTLNFKQTLAFLLMVNNALVKKENPSVVSAPLLVTGEGGTGKSRVINTFAAWMDKEGERQKAKKKDKVDDSNPLPSKPVDLAIITDAVRAELEPVENLIVDEVSMLGHQLHSRLHQTCCLAKLGSSLGSHMGGINTFYFGDFLQFRPVLDTALYLPPKKGTLNLWPNREFMERLQKVQSRMCDKDDYLLLQERIIGAVDGPKLAQKEWQDTLFIVQRHQLRREINRRRATCLAQALRQPVFVSPAQYSSAKIAVTAKETKELSQLSPREHDNLESVLHLTIGMPLVLYDNDHASQGITNGAYGTLVGIHLHSADAGSFVADRGFQQVVLCNPPAQLLVKLRSPHQHRAKLSNLPPSTIPITPREGSVTLKLSNWTDQHGRTHTQQAAVKALQSPVSAAWAVTDYRVQGETRLRVTADLSPPPAGRIDPAAAYVAMFRVTTFEGLSFLRSFPLSVLRSGLDDEVNEELLRQKKAEKQTLRRIERMIESRGWKTEYEAFAAAKHFPPI